MSGNKIFIDTNIAIYLLNGDTSLAEILNYKQLYASFITQLELLGYPNLSEKQIQQIEFMLENCIILDINNKIKEYTIYLRKKHRIKLPDSIVAATALYLDLPLITADKGFEKIHELNLMMYEK
jgi:predicted nucleic acid-binding protein